MRVQDAANPITRKPTRTEITHWVIIAGLILGLAFGALMSGERKSERTHRALEQQYRRCVDRYGYGGDGFPACLRGER